MCQIAAHADDIVMIVLSKLAMRDKFLNVQQETEEIELVVNKVQTKYLKVRKDALSDNYLRTENIKFKVPKDSNTWDQ